MAQTNAVLGSCIRPSIHDPVTGGVLAQAEFSFFEKDKVTLKPVYTSPDRSLEYANPLILDSVGSEPPIYYDTDEEYWIEIRRPPAAGCACMTGDLIYPGFFFFPGLSGSGSATGEEVYNFISNGQFKNKIIFNNPGESLGVISEQTTPIAMGWTLNASSPVFNNDLFFKFVDVEADPLFFNTGNPVNVLDVQCNSTEYLLMELDTPIGHAARLKNEDVTLSLTGKELNSQTVTISVSIRQIYGGSIPPVTTKVGDIVLDSTSVALKSLIFNMPSLINDVSDSDQSRCNLVLQFPNQSAFHLQLTNIQLERGVINNPSYIEQPGSLSDAKSFFDNFIFPDSERPDEISKILNFKAYDRLIYNNGKFGWQSMAGLFSPVVKTAVPDEMELVNGQEVKRTDYTASGIPYERLWRVWGNTFGGTSGWVSTSSGSTLTISSAGGAKEKSVFTVGDLGTKITLTKVQEGLPLGIYATPHESINKVKVEFFHPFAPNKSAATVPVTVGLVQDGQNFGFFKRIYDAFRFVTFVDLTPGSPTTWASSLIEFNTPNVFNYETIQDSVGTLGVWPARFFEFSSFDLATRGSYAPTGTTKSAMVIRIAVDGKEDPPSYLTGVEHTTIIQFSTHLSLADNLKTFIEQVNSQFSYTITFNVAPNASEYFFISDGITRSDQSASALDYYVWAKVDGIGTDPAVAGRVGIQVDFNSADSLEVIAKKYSDVLNSATFQFPNANDLPNIPDNKLAWAVFT
jgi:hypothetical protein